MKYKVGDKIRYNYVNKYWSPGYLKENGIYIIVGCVPIEQYHVPYYIIQNYSNTPDLYSCDGWDADFVDTNTTLYRPIINKIEII